MKTSLLRNSVCVISSCSRGIGLEFTKNILKEGNIVIGLCREENHNTNLNQLKQLYPNSFNIIDGVDVQNQESIDKMEKEIKSKYKSIDMLINVSAVLSDESNKPERSLSTLSRDWITKTMDVNLIGHV